MYKFGEIIEGSLSIKQEEQFFQSCGRKFLLEVLSFYRESIEGHIALLSGEPTRKNFSTFLSFLDDCVTNIEKEHTFLTNDSNVAFYSVKHSARVEIAKVHNLSDREIENVFEMIYIPLLKEAVKLN